jgi:hypothetical protein
MMQQLRSAELLLIIITNLASICDILTWPRSAMRSNSSMIISMYMWWTLIVITMGAGSIFGR